MNRISLRGKHYVTQAYQDLHNTLSIVMDSTQAQDENYPVLITVEFTLPDISQLSVESPTPSLVRTPRVGSPEVLPKSEKEEVAQHSQGATKPDGPKNSDPFQFGSRYAFDSQSPRLYG